jgi:hypothetical protein
MVRYVSRKGSQAVQSLSDISGLRNCARPCKGSFSLFQDNGKFRQVRLVDIWYKHKGGWRWALFTRSAILKQGDSPFSDADDKQICKYLMFSAQVDHDGDRYGFPRNLISAQDEAVGSPWRVYPVSGSTPARNFEIGFASRDEPMASASRRPMAHL